MKCHGHQEPVSNSSTGTVRGLATCTFKALILTDDDELGDTPLSLEGQLEQHHAPWRINGLTATSAKVNSYHRSGLPGTAVSERITPLVFAPDGSVEAFIHLAHRWPAAMVGRLASTWAGYSLPANAGRRSVKCKGNTCG